MATVSLSPTPAPVAIMSSRRGPLTSIPHAANSPMRGAAAAIAAYSKQKRSHANLQREEAYGQPPPNKKQVLENGTHRAVRSPSKLPRSQTTTLPQRGLSSTTTIRGTTRERGRLSTTSRVVENDPNEQKEVWKKHYRAKFPKMVFYFESVPDDIRAKLTKKVTYLGARQEPFFSIDVTHVITTRTIPSERSEALAAEVPEQEEREPEEQPQTINPSLLDRNTAARRKLLFEFRNVPSRSQQVNDPTKPGKGARNNDVLHKAREMGKKIWSLDKFQTMVTVLLESDSQQTVQGTRGISSRSAQHTLKGSNEPSLLQLLHNERIHGPSDRDPSASNRELSHFKGPYIYVWDMDEKHKPVMVREYAKVANKSDGDWPQFRSVGNGRCPFVEDVDIPEREHRRQREQQVKARPAKREEASAIPKPVDVSVTKQVTGKRTLAEMEDGHNRAQSVTEVFNPAKASLSKQATQNAFTSRAEGGRVFHGEPVASGLQAASITSAVRSQMISSTSGLSGVKAGTSKEIHGLQRKVLQKTAPTSHASSRLAEQQSVEAATSSRSVPLTRQTSKTTLGQDEDVAKATESKERKSQSQPLKSKKDLKPGYCENCQDKFRDFDEHIVSRKHRKFAENDDNWGELDSLLTQLKRVSKAVVIQDDDEWQY
ncbi:unnamed protein product [Clonostachys solani]|uniref:DBF4-type domain-containing protein n=1 Tax=Clonostachys solani TaxID=160281 RepID=A0A9N9ZJE5_9HYPO|nr:unnamed protein product [Clonostachys solani]